MDLPTYTNIWRIEKRLYKLYDFRLPMPLPINWIAVFAGITIPYIILLIAIGLPFNHSLVWLYVLPPGVLTWLTTRPVIENKRLPELVESQARYLMEPRTWVRLTPLSEKDQTVLTARVWRSRPPRRPARTASAPGLASASRAVLPTTEQARESRPLHAGPVLKPTSVFRPEPAAAQGLAPRQRRAASALQRPAAAERSSAQQGSPAQERSRVQERARAMADGRGTARRAPVLPAARPLPPVTPVVADESSGLPAGLFGAVLGPGGLPGRQQRDGAPVHAMPDVVPPAAAAPSSLPAQAPVLPPATASQPAPAAASPRAQAPRPARVVVPAPPGKPEQPHVRIRAGATGGASLELSHDGPGRRPAAGHAGGTRCPGRRARLADPAAAHACAADTAGPAVRPGERLARRGAPVAYRAARCGRRRAPGRGKRARGWQRRDGCRARQPGGDTARDGPGDARRLPGVPAGPCRRLRRRSNRGPGPGTSAASRPVVFRPGP